MSLHWKNRFLTAYEHVTNIFVTHKSISTCINFTECLLFAVDDIVIILKINILVIIICLSIIAVSILCFVITSLEAVSSPTFFIFFICHIIILIGCEIKTYPRPTSFTLAKSLTLKVLAIHLNNSYICILDYIISLKF